MKFSAQEEFGLRCLLVMARKAPGSGTTIPEIARLENLSQPHVAKLLAILRREGIIKSTRGQLGGYALAHDPSEIIIGNVLAALGGKLYESEFCERHSGLTPTCVHDGTCSLRPFWQSIQDAVDSVVNKVTLKDLLDSSLPSVSKIEFSNTRESVGSSS